MINNLEIKSIEEIYEDMIPVGEGSYGIVYRAVNIKLNKLVAVKVFKEKFTKESEDEIFYEINIIRKFKH